MAKLKRLKLQSTPMQPLRATSAGKSRDTLRSRPQARTTTSRPPTTVAQSGSVRVNWTRTFHVDTSAAFISGLFGLYSDVFRSFLRDAGRGASVGETVLYQVRTPPHLRFELRKIGPNEFEVRGAHFATPRRINICVGIKPVE